MVLFPSRLRRQIHIQDENEYDVVRHYSTIYILQLFYSHLPLCTKDSIKQNRKLLIAFWKQPQYKCCQTFLAFGFRELNDKVLQYFLCNVVSQGI